MIDYKRLTNLSTVRRYQKNTIIIREGDEMPHSMYVILQGEVRVVKNYGQTGQSLVATLEPGSFFGEMSLFLFKPRTATVISKEDVMLLEINQSNVYEIIEKEPDMLHSILKTLCQRIDGLNSRISERGI